jgi:PrgI family protein
MFNDRDLSILGAGAVAAILCLMLPWTFALKVAVAVVVLVIAMALAFVRMGADRLTLEQYLKRQLVFRFQPRKYSYFQKEKVPARSVPAAISQRQAADRPSFGPLSLDFHEKGLYWLMTIWLIVIGVYVLYWAHFLGGLDQAAFWIKHSFKFK